jgi:carbon monoxide dehydrogenase subunit G
MKLEQSFTVDAPVGQVWDALIDVERIAPCLPGAEITGVDDDGAYQGSFTVKLGPTTAAYRGSLKMESVDEAARTATMSAKGTDKRGQGGASATIVSTMREDAGATHVEVLTDFHITGRLARFGRSGMIEDISKRLMRDFAECLQATIAAGGGAAAADAAVASAGGAAAEAASAAAAPPGTEEMADGPAAPASEPPASPPAPPTAEPPASAPAPPAPPSAQPAPTAPPAPEAPPAPPAPEPPPDEPRTESIAPPTRADRPVPQPAKPIRGFSLFFGVLWDRIKRFFAGLFGRKS